MSNQARAHKVLALKNCSQGRYEFSRSLRLDDVATRPNPHGFLCNGERTILAQEQNFRFWDTFSNLSTRFETIDAWKPDIQQDQVRMQLLSHLDRFSAVRRLADDLELGLFLKGGSDEPTPRLVIVNHENSKSRFLQKG